MSSLKKKRKRDFSLIEKSKFWSTIHNLPLTLAVGLAVFGTVAVGLLLLEQFNTLLVVAFGGISSFLMMYLVNKRLSPVVNGSIFESRLFNILAVVSILSWLVYNLSYNAQTVYLYRDPGLYNTTAKWMMDNDNIAVPSINPFGENNNLFTSSNAGVNILKDEPGRLFTHGMHMLPSFTATVGRIIHESAALKTNIAIGAIALLSFYGFTRLFAKPRWAFLSMIALSLSLPMLYFSRDMYTEPLLMLFFFGMLSSLYYAKKQPNKLLWFISGFMAGATLMTRIDAYLILVAVAAYVSIYLLLSKKSYRLDSLKNSLVLLMGVLVTATLAWLDLTQLATAYYRFHDSLILLELLLLITVVIIGSIITLIYWNDKKFMGFISGLYKKLPITQIVIALIITIFGFLLARPLYINKTNFYEIQNIGGTQSIVGQKSYTPNSFVYDSGEPVVLWSVWYLGLALSLLALIGLVLLVKKGSRDKTLLLLPFIISFVSLASLYFFKPNITPDQIWASRRILPIVLPGIAFLAAYGLSYIDLRRSYTFVLYIAVGFIFITSVLDTSNFFINQKSNSPLLTQVNSFCEELPQDSAVLLIGIMGLVGVQTINSYCGVPTVRHVETPQLAEFQQFYINSIDNGYTPVVAAFDNDIGLYVENSFIKKLGKTNYKTIDKVFGKPPEKMVSTYKQITYGFLQPDGKVSLTYGN